MTEAKGPCLPAEISMIGIIFENGAGSFYEFSAKERIHLYAHRVLSSASLLGMGVFDDLAARCSAQRAQVAIIDRTVLKSAIVKIIVQCLSHNLP